MRCVQRRACPRPLHLNLFPTSTPPLINYFVTIEDETGDVQIILWPRVFARCRRELGSQVVEVRGEVSRWDGTTNVIVSDLRAIRSGVSMPPSHDWR